MSQVVRSVLLSAHVLGGRPVGMLAQHILGLCFQSHEKAGSGKGCIAKIICQSNELFLNLCSAMYCVATELLQGPAGLQKALAPFLTDGPCPSNFPGSNTRAGQGGAVMQQRCIK